MSEDDKDLTTFICHCGLFLFKVMPFGLVNAPATFSRIMRRLLRDSLNLNNYLDDVLAHTKEWKGHLRVLQDFFEHVKSANLSLHPSKCEIEQLGPFYWAIVVPSVTRCRCCRRRRCGYRCAGGM